MDKPQTIHVDSRAINFEVIAVVKCGNDGYELEYVPRSHLLTGDEILEDTPIDPGMIKLVAAKQGQFICFFDTLFHGGGIASTPLQHWLDSSFKNATKNLTGGEATDIAYQLTLHRYGINSLDMGKAANVWFSRIASDAATKEEFKNYVDASPGRQFAFQKETEQLRSKYFKMLMDARNGNSRCTRRSK